MKPKNAEGGAVGLEPVVSCDEFYTEDGQPIKCWKCGCTEMKEVVRSVVAVLPGGQGPTCEAEYVCAGCGFGLGYWAYGYWDPRYREDLAANAQVQPRICQETKSNE